MHAINRGIQTAITITLCLIAVGCGEIGWEESTSTPSRDAAGDVEETRVIASSNVACSQHWQCVGTGALFGSCALAESQCVSGRCATLVDSVCYESGGGDQDVLAGVGGGSICAPTVGPSEQPDELGACRLREVKEAQHDAYQTWFQVVCSDTSNCGSVEIDWFRLIEIAPSGTHVIRTNDSDLSGVTWLSEYYDRANWFQVNTHSTVSIEQGQNNFVVDAVDPTVVYHGGGDRVDGFLRAQPQLYVEARVRVHGSAKIQLGADWYTNLDDQVEVYGIVNKESLLSSWWSCNNEWVVVRTPVTGSGAANSWADCGNQNTKTSAAETPGTFDGATPTPDPTPAPEPEPAPQDSDGDGVLDASDCAPHDPLRFEGNSEVCDAIDNNCDGGVDEGLSTRWYYRDRDDDGYGGSYSRRECRQPSGYVSNNDDCDDNASDVHPGAQEASQADGIDQNCDPTDEPLATQYTSSRPDLWISGSSPEADLVLARTNNDILIRQSAWQFGDGYSLATVAVSSLRASWWGTRTNHSGWENRRVRSMTINGEIWLIVSVPTDMRDGWSPYRGAASCGSRQVLPARFNVHTADHSDWVWVSSADSGGAYWQGYDTEGIGTESFAASRSNNVLVLSGYHTSMTSLCD